MAKWYEFIEWKINKIEVINNDNARLLLSHWATIDDKFFFRRPNRSLLVFLRAHTHTDTECTQNVKKKPQFTLINYTFGRNWRALCGKRNQQHVSKMKQIRSTPAALVRQLKCGYSLSSALSSLSRQLIHLIFGKKREILFLCCRWSARTYLPMENHRHLNSSTDRSDSDCATRWVEANFVFLLLCVSLEVRETGSSLCVCNRVFTTTTRMFLASTSTAHLPSP